MQRDLAAMRRDYRQGTLTEEMAGVDTLTLFDQWIVAARDAGQIEANAMTLATVDAMGHPHARIVLLKEQVARDFVFFTNYQSAKGQQLAASQAQPWCFGGTCWSVKCASKAQCDGLIPRTVMPILPADR